MSQSRRRLGGASADGQFEVATLGVDVVHAAVDGRIFLYLHEGRLSLFIYVFGRCLLRVEVDERSCTKGLQCIWLRLSLHLSVVWSVARAPCSASQLSSLQRFACHTSTAPDAVAYRT